MAASSTAPVAGHGQSAGTFGHHASDQHGGGVGAPVAHHFNNMLQQQATVRFGMWLFLVTEVLFFGGAFCAYTAYRIWFPREFEAGSAALNVGIATVNTFLLLTSSLTLTLAIRACYKQSQSLLKFWLGMTIILGAVFLGLKMREYQLDYQEGLTPTGANVVVNAFPAIEQRMPDGSLQMVQSETTVPVSVPLFQYRVEKALLAAHYDPTGVNLARVQLFFIFYYVMTGLHVVHMIIGIGILGWQFTMAHFGFFKYPERYVYIEVMSLYWHFVDMVWMFLLPLLYLAGPHTFEQVGEGLRVAFGLAGHGG